MKRKKAITGKVGDEHPQSTGPSSADELAKFVNNISVAETSYRISGSRAPLGGTTQQGAE